jgi:hypothetical protein
MEVELGFDPSSAEPYRVPSRRWLFALSPSSRRRSVVTWFRRAGKFPDVRRARSESQLLGTGWTAASYTSRVIVSTHV